MLYFRSVFKKVKTSRKIKLIIADDKSTEKNHIASLLYIAHLNKIKEIIIYHTTNKKWGIGASMNNALKEAWNYSDKCLTIEDDWILEKELDLDMHINTMNSDNTIMGIKLAQASNNFIKYNEKYNIHHNYNWIYNFQIMIRSKKIFNNPNFSYFLENVKPDKSEEHIALLFNNAFKNGNDKNFKILMPAFFKYDIIDDPSLYFTHVGKSTMNHPYKVPSRYQWLYENQLESSKDYLLKLPNDFKIKDIIDKDKSKISVKNAAIREYIVFK